MSDAPATSASESTPEPAETGVYYPSESAAELVRVLDECQAELQAGRPLDKARLLAEHPAVAGQLDDCLAAIEFVHRAGVPAAGTPSQLGDFRIVREVGRGGMGVVYEAEQLSLKRKVALKVLRFGATADAEVMQRFQREAETVAHLHHTNIVPIHAVGCEQGVHYYAMQFIEGKSLAEEIQSVPARRENPQSAIVVAGWTLQAAEALAHAHQRGVIHRDIKPSNLILDPEGTVWLTDFGLAKRADEVTMTAAGVLLGTPRYMSPEQAASTQAPVNHRTDIYSLGATLYELATGRPVFDSQTPQGVISQILTTEPVAPRVIQGKLPRDLETIILKCLAKEPSRRYQHARDLADDLRAFLEHRPIKARRASVVERAGRWLKKHRKSSVVSGATALASIVLIAAGYYGWAAYQQSLLGKLALETDGPSLVAEVLDARGELAIPSFPVPTPEPAVLRAGSYTVRLSGSGVLSEDWLIEVERGKLAKYPVKLQDRLHGQPVEVLNRDPPKWFEFNGQTHVLIGAQHGWRLHNGATLGSVTPNEIKLPPNPVPTSDPNSAVRPDEWNQLLQGYSDFGNYTFPSTGHSPGLAQPAVDVNGDGNQDLVFAARRCPALIALSGGTSQVLWLFRAASFWPPEIEDAADPIDPAASNQLAGIVGQPLTTHIGGKPAIVAVFASIGGGLRTKGGKDITGWGYTWLEAVSAADGKSLWRAPLIKLETQSISNWDMDRHFPPTPQVFRLAGREAIVLQAESTLFALDLETGDSVSSVALPAQPIQQTQYADLDGDGEPEAICFCRPDLNKDGILLRAISLKSGEPLWECPYLCPLYLNRERLGEPGQEIAWVMHVTGEKKADVLIALRDDWSKQGKHWFGVALLDGQTGKPRWQRKLWSPGNYYFETSGNNSTDTVRALLGPDLDGDGQREVFAATSATFTRGLARDANSVRPPVEMPSLQVEALSGADGRILWQKQFAVSEPHHYDRSGPLAWWQADNDGWPQLVVPERKGPGGQPITYVLSAGDGRLTHTLPEVPNPHVADVNSDGIPDLHYLTGEEGTRRLHVLRGQPPVVWRRGVNWKLAADFNGDGVRDFREWQTGDSMPTTLVTRSGRDGTMLWRTQIQPDSWGWDREVAEIDVDDDGTPDVVLLEGFPSPDGSEEAVSAFSGKDGRRLWAATDIGLNFSSTGVHGGRLHRQFSYPMFDQQDLDGDGRPEILLVAQIALQNTFSLARLTRDGELRWKVPIMNGAYAGTSLIDRHIWGDLNADGVLDIVLWVPQSIGEHGIAVGAELQAYSGQDGKPLWSTAAKFAEGLAPEYGGGWRLWPRTALADLDGDGTAEVVATGTNGKDKNVLVVLEGSSGKLKWSWSGDWKSFENIWPPLLVDFEGNGRRSVCLGVPEQLPMGNSSYNVLVFDAAGTIQWRIPVQYVGDASAWTAFDADGDGKEELFYKDAGTFHAYRGGDDRDLWKRTMENFTYQFDELIPGSKGHTPTLILWTGNSTISGLDTATGKTRWRYDFPQQNQFGPSAHVVDFSAQDELPKIVSRSLGTRLQKVWPIDEGGNYQPIAPQPMTYAEYVAPVSYRPLPWVRRGASLNPLRGLSDGPFKAFLALTEWPVFLAFAGTLFCFAWRAQWRRAIIYFALFCLFAIGLAALMFSLGRPLEESERYAWHGWYWLVWNAGLPFGAITALVLLFIWIVGRAKTIIGKTKTAAN